MQIARKITFCPHLHRLVMDGTKTVTRRIKTSVREGEIIAAVTGWRTPCGADVTRPTDLDQSIPFLWASQATATPWGRCRPAMFFPRHMYHRAPLLRVTSVRRERLWDITEEDAMREGIVATCGLADCTAGPNGPIYHNNYRFLFDSPACPDKGFEDAVSAFAALWDSINTAPGRRWADNPEVTRVEFEPVKGGQQ